VADTAVSSFAVFQYFGQNGNFSLDDGLAAGLLIRKMKDKGRIQVSDTGLAMVLALNKNLSLKELLEECYHLKLLQARGFQADIDYCLSSDMMDVVPKYVNGKFILY